MVSTFLRKALVARNRAFSKSLQSRRTLIRTRVNRNHVISCCSSFSFSFNSSSTFSSSSSIPDPNIQRTNSLRALRKGQAATPAKDTVDYRYRNNNGNGNGNGNDNTNGNGSGSGNAESLSKLWGSEIDAERDRQRIIQQQKDAATATANNATDTSTRRKISTNVMNRNGTSERRKKKKFVSFFDEVDEKMERHKRGTNSSLMSALDQMEKSENGNGNENGTTRIDGLLNALHSKESGSASTSASAMTTGGDTLTQQDKVPTTIFDAFKQKKENPKAFEKRDFQEYREMMQSVIQGEKFAKRHTSNPLNDDIVNPVIDYLLRDEKILPCNYPTLKEAATDGISMTMERNDDEHQKGKKTKSKKSKDLFRPEVSEEGSQAHTFHGEIQRQKDAFLDLTKFDSDQYDLTKRTFHILASLCAKNATSAPLSIAWQKIKEAGLIPSNETLSVYLYVMGIVNTKGFLQSSLGRSLSRPAGDNTMSAVMSILGSTGGTSNNKEKEKGDEPIDFPTEVALFHDLLYMPTEKSVSLRVKKLVSIGDASNAQKLLDSFSSKDGARLRTYLPIMKLYCEQGNVSSALKLFKRMRDETYVILEAENYVLLISSLAENGYFSRDSDPIDGATQIGYENSYGPELFNQLLNEMSEDVLEISSASARRLHNALAVGLEKEKNMRIPELIHSLGSVPLNNESAEANDLIASRVTVGKTTGLCPRSRVTLRLINLNRDHRKQLHRSLLNLSHKQYEEFTGRRWDNNAAEKLDEFSNWLEKRNGKPFTAIVDGANVGYYMQNFDKGRFNFYQIQFIVEALESMNENPLVILPYKYLSSSFTIMNGSSYRKQHMDTDEIEIMDNLLRKGQLYRVPPRCLDDFYWMVASVSDQTVSRNGMDIDVKAGSGDGRWPGARPMLISNDQMRDHKLSLLEPRLFRRWTSCYIVNYSFTAFVGKESADKEISFSTADFYSREIQSNESKHGTAWHFPVRDWPIDDRFCVRIPENTSEKVT